MDVNTLTQFLIDKQTRPLFSTLKRTERTFHSAVGYSLVSTWWEYRLSVFNGCIHLSRTEYVNGQAQWSGCSYGTTDTQRILRQFGITVGA